MLRPHFVKIFQWIDDVLSRLASDVFVCRPMEALLITMWQGVFRPDECVGTPKNKTFPHMDQVVFRGAYGAPVAYAVPYEKVNYCDFDPDGRKNDPGRTNPPVILAVDHTMASRRFSACYLPITFAIQSDITTSGQAVGYPSVPDASEGPHFQSV
jgi:hypothetical protein